MKTQTTIKARHQQTFGMLVAATALALSLAVTHKAGAASWVSNSPMAAVRCNHTATLLPNGKALVVGGQGSNNVYLASAELYDPATGKWTSAGSLTTARYGHVAILLPNGKVLVAGGESTNGICLDNAEVYNPVTETWMPTGAMTLPRRSPTATLLSTGKVVVTGGVQCSNGAPLEWEELYDPVTGTWTAAGRTLFIARAGHTATLLPNDYVLYAGGLYANNSAELSHPPSSESGTGAMTSSRRYHTATLLPDGTVLAAGGQDSNNVYLSSAELYDPAGGTWTATGNLSPGRAFHTATLLADGKVLVAGGINGSWYSQISGTKLYDPATGTWADAGDLNTGRACHTATLLSSGKVLVTGGRGGNIFFSSTEVYDPAINPSTGAWVNTAPLNRARKTHTATLLCNGKVLVTGGMREWPDYFSSSEIYDPNSAAWTNTGAMNTERGAHTATLLPNGKVLAAGGQNLDGYVTNSELYDPASGVWTVTGSMTEGRISHATTLLSNGKVLVTGGQSSSAELYDAVAGVWTATGSMTTNRAGHTATLLPTGKVLVAGGSGLSSAELYDPATGTWTTTGSMSTNRGGHTATLLPNGKVLVAAGSYYSGGYHYLSGAELYDPATGTWALTSALTTARAGHTATMLPDGMVLVAGGNNESFIYLSSSEMYDPATSKWTTIGAMKAMRSGHTATLLLNGKVLVTAGANCTYNCEISAAELYDPRPDFDSSRQPQFATVTSPFSLGRSLVITGSKLRGMSEGSSGNSQSSPADCPVLQLRSVATEQTVFLLATGWSTNFLTAVMATNFPLGWTLVTAFVGGIPSATSMILVQMPAPMLTITHSNSAVTLSWPMSADGWVLEWTNALSQAEVPWMQILAPYQTNGPNLQFTEPDHTGNRFYHLHKP